MTRRKPDMGVTPRYEDRTFLSLIKRYTKKRDWDMVRCLFRDYGKVLEDRLS